MNGRCSIKVFSICLAAVIVAATLSGCAEPKIEFREIHRVDEVLSQTDLDRLYRIADFLHSKRLPELAPHFLAEPQWDENRPASIATLAGEEFARLEETIQLPVLIGSLKKNPRLDYALKREKLTRSQFVGLVLAVGMAIHRSRLDEARDLDEYLETGRIEIRDLKSRNESFATLPLDQRMSALEQATWITRVDRAERLKTVPDENVELVSNEFDKLRKIMPEEFLTDPLFGINDPLIDYGVPFREIGSTGFDAEISWRRDDDEAIIDGESAIQNTISFLHKEPTAPSQTAASEESTAQ